MRIEVDSRKAHIAGGIFFLGLYAFIGLALYVYTL
jgi:hypothetical protein